VPYVVVSSSKVVLDAADTETKLWDVVQRNGFSMSDSQLAHSGNDGDCAFAWVHSRKTNGKLLISSQTLVSANTKLAEYQGELAYNLARSSYGMSEDVYLSPGEVESGGESTPSGGGGNDSL
jgi:hypothetical protein